MGCKEFKLANVTLLPLPDKSWTGWWSKLNLFSPELEKYRPFLYLDLDTAVLKDYLHLLPKEGWEDCFITLRDFYRPSKLASGVMWIPSNNKKVDFIWNRWGRDPEKNMQRYRGDQEFIGDMLTSDLYWQDLPNFFNSISSFKPKGKQLIKLSGEECIVCFHGKPRIPEAAKNVYWVEQYIKDAAIIKTKKELV